MFKYNLTYRRSSTCMLSFLLALRNLILALSSPLVSLFYISLINIKIQKIIKTQVTLSQGLALDLSSYFKKLGASLFGHLHSDFSKKLTPPSQISFSQSILYHFVSLSFCPKIGGQGNSFSHLGYLPEALSSKFPKKFLLGTFVHILDIILSL